MPAHLLALDGSNLLMRAFHGAGCTAADEVVPTVWHMIQGLIRRHTPTHLVVALDAPGPTWRHERYPAYKATRADRTGPSPAELTAAIRPHLVTWGVVTAEASGYEADDVLATLARRCEDHGSAISIVSDDRDLLQLVREGVRVLRPGRGSAGETAFAFAEDVRALLAVDPGLVADWKALAGDAGDGIPRVELPKETKAGVRMFGFTAKRAAELIREVGDLDDIYASLWRVQPVEHRWLTACREQAFLSRELARLIEDVPLELDAAATSVRRSKFAWRVAA